MPSFPKIISFVFHPLWIPLLSFVFITYIDNSLVYNDQVWWWIIFLLLVNIIVPAISLYYMIRKGALSGVELEHRRERTLPYLLVIVYYCIFYYVLWKFEPVVSFLIFSMFFSILTSLILALIVNYFWKISVHLLAIGGLAGVLAALPFYHSEINTFPYLIMVVILSGVIGYARIELKAHTKSQVYVGFLVGFLIHYVFVYNGYHLVLHPS